MPSRRHAEVESLESRRLLAVLTFDPDGVNQNALPPAYGDRVVAAAQNNFDYGTAGGTCTGGLALGWAASWAAMAQTVGANSVSEVIVTPP